VSWADIPEWLRDLVGARDGERCQYCRMSQRGQGARFHLDHIWPQCRGGPTEADNIVVACVNCSLRKASKVTGNDPETRLSTALFHPLRQQWDDHFELRPDGHCVGLDAIGRATVDALGMNEPRPLVARAMQIQHGMLRPTVGTPPGEN